MRGLVRRLKNVMFRWKKESPLSYKLPSLVRAMDNLVPRKVMREVVASSHDRRQWGVLAAAWVGVSEREFFEAAAKAMRVRLEERLTPPDLTVFGTGARSMLQELRRVGATIALQGKTITQIVAVDPAEVRGLSFYDGKLAVSLASWTDISRVLDAAERMIVEDESNAEHREAKRRQEVCGKIMNIIVREAAAHGAQSVEVITTDGKTRYQFCTSHGKTATGSIRPEVVQDLLKFLCSLEGSVIRTESQGDVVLRSLGSSSNFRLSWGNSAPLPLPQTERALPAPSNRPANTDMLPAVRAEENFVRSVVSDGYTAADTAEDQPVLVVDDNPMFCRVLERLLRKEGVNPCFAENGVVALEKLEAARDVLPKVIICDLHMPIMNGRELLARLKGDPRLKVIPIVMLTSDDDVDAELQLLAGGADAFVSKAKDPRVLTAQIQRLLKLSGMRKAA